MKKSINQISRVEKQKVLQFTMMQKKDYPMYEKQPNVDYPAKASYEIVTENGLKT